MEFPLRSSLGFPFGFSSGFDPTHRAASNANVVSVVAGNGGFLRTNQSVRGTVTGTPSTISLNGIGPTAACTNSSYVSFSGQPTSTTTINAAAIVVFDTVDANFRPFMCNSSVAGLGFTLSVFQSNLEANFLGGTNYNLLVSPKTFTPYFVAVSALGSGGALNGVVVNLVTGAVTTSTFGSGTTAASDGTYVFGMAQFAAASTTNYIAAAMMSGSAISQQLSIGELLQWASDPWGFWYPDANRFLMPFDGNVGVVGVAGARIPYWFDDAQSVSGFFDTQLDQRPWFDPTLYAFGNFPRRLPLMGAG